ncbi:hypothetical protein QGX17_gp054 [Pseudomonas phage phiPsa381]|uniref:Uncharacterized protein n=1 Tax=Pseudomonas phage phiPsa381 TaxID=1460366 RepID=A0A7G9V341_9CAUD|nr:hypothetical protein QGX17_gp054 [Pseudomonas phage phiPsa381]QNO00697.1 hypothetical protein phiPsa381_170 [Pseudomonas phage phiPsa381]
MQVSHADLVVAVDQAVKDVAAVKVAHAQATIAAWYPVTDKRQAALRSHFLSGANELLAKWVKYL